MQRQHLSRRMRLLVGLIATLVVLGACTASTLTPEAYFDTLNLETERYDRALDELRATYGEELEEELDDLQTGTDFSDTSAVDSYFDQSKEVAIVKTAELFTSSGGELRSFLDRINDMEPPEAFLTVHQDVLAAGEALAASMPVTIQAVRSLEAIDQLQETLADTPYSLAAQRFQIACQNLETSAASESIDVDLDCPVGPSVVGDG